MRSLNGACVFLISTTVPATMAVFNDVKKATTLDNVVLGNEARRELTVTAFPKQVCISRWVFEELIDNAVCLDNLCDGTWLTGTEAEHWLTCHFDACGPGLHYQAQLGLAIAWEACYVAGCGSLDCNAKLADMCDVCDCTGPCYFEFDKCDNDYLNRVLGEFSRLVGRDCYDPDCMCITQYRTGFCAGDAVDACDSFSKLADWICPELNECGGDGNDPTPSTFQQIYDRIVEARDVWCEEAGIVPTLNCEWMPAEQTDDGSQCGGFDFLNGFGQNLRSMLPLVLLVAIF